MKTKEEIEHLAENSSYNSEHFEDYQDGMFYGFKLLKHIFLALGIAFDKTNILVNEHDWSRNPQAQLKDFFNSNKKGNEK